MPKVKPEFTGNTRRYIF